jgi:ABC-type Fe3+/spermidine/putrescine transport system ATPase subunit
MTSALSLKSLTKRFRSVVAVDDVSIEIGVGEFVALLGPSGSGKTTMLRLLAGFDLPSAGQIVIEGRDVSGLPPAERNIGMVFQHYALFPHMNIRRNIEYGLRMHGWAPADRKARVDELLAMVRLEAVGNRMPHQLSGGQQQRIAIARALAYSPSILLMDEPLGALDRALRIEMAEEIRRIHRTLGTTFIYVTHDRDEAMTLADRVLIMHGGKIEADDSPETLFQRPPTAFVAGFFSGMNVVPAADLGVPTSQTVGISPGSIRFTQPDSPHIALEATILDRLFLGEKIQFVLSVHPDKPPLIASSPATDPNDYKIADRITVFIRSTDMISLL